MDINTRNWVDLAQVRIYWRVLVNATLNRRICLVIRNIRIFLEFFLSEFLTVMSLGT